MTAVVKPMATCVTSTHEADKLCMCVHLPACRHSVHQLACCERLHCDAHAALPCPVPVCSPCFSDSSAVTTLLLSQPTKTPVKLTLPEQLTTTSSPSRPVTSPCLTTRRALPMFLLR
jgi:hypothetical protein